MRIEDFHIDFDSLKFGDKLWDIVMGEVFVTEIGSKNMANPISVSSGGVIKTYSATGVFLKHHNYPSLYKSNPFEHLDGFKEREMWVRDRENHPWVKRNVVLKRKGKFIATYITVDNEYHEWKFAKEIESEPTLEDQVRELTEKIEAIKKVIEEQKVAIEGKISYIS